MFAVVRRSAQSDGGGGCVACAPELGSPDPYFRPTDVDAYAIDTIVVTLHDLLVREFDQNNSRRLPEIEAEISRAIGFDYKVCLEMPDPLAVIEQLVPALRNVRETWVANLQAEGCPGAIQGSPSEQFLNRVTRELRDLIASGRIRLNRQLLAQVHKSLDQILPLCADILLIEPERKGDWIGNEKQKILKSLRDRTGQGLLDWNFVAHRVCSFLFVHYLDSRKLKTDSARLGQIQSTQKLVLAEIRALEDLFGAVGKAFPPLWNYRFKFNEFLEIAFKDTPAAPLVRKMLDGIVATSSPDIDDMYLELRRFLILAISAFEQAGYQERSVAVKFFNVSNLSTELADQPALLKKAKASLQFAEPQTVMMIKFNALGADWDKLFGEPYFPELAKMVAVSNSANFFYYKNGGPNAIGEFIIIARCQYKWA